MREGNAPLSEQEQRTYQVVESFYELMKEEFDDMPNAKRHEEEASDSNDVIYRGEDYRGGYPPEDSDSRSMPLNEESYGAEDDEDGDGESEEEV